MGEDPPSRKFLDYWHGAYFVTFAVWRFVLVVGWQRWDYEHVWEMLRYDGPPLKIAKRRGR